MGCEEKRAAVIQGHCVATRLSTNNALQRCTVLSETSKWSQDFPALWSTGKEKRKMEAVKNAGSGTRLSWVWITAFPLSMHHLWHLQLSVSLTRKWDLCHPPHRAAVRSKWEKACSWHMVNSQRLGTTINNCKYICIAEKKKIRFGRSPVTALQLAL